MNEGPPGWRALVFPGAVILVACCREGLVGHWEHVVTVVDTRHGECCATQAIPSPSPRNSIAAAPPSACGSRSHHRAAIPLTEGARPAYSFALSDLLLVIEVASPGNPRYDYHTKRTLYLSSGISEYWVVNPDARNIARWQARDDPGEVLSRTIGWQPAGLSKEGADIAKRDWVGHDFTAWVHDLHRPTEAYAARGAHPSGVGINRYVKASDLTAEEHDFLVPEGHLQLTNFLDPNLRAFGGITLRNPCAGGDVRMTASASHYFTSFGRTVDLNVFVKQDMTNIVVALHRYTNGARSLPGLEAQLLDAPITLARTSLDVSPRVALWMQPERQAFRSAAAEPGALVSLRVRPATLARLGVFAELEGKTAGWVASSVHLEWNVSVRLGGSVRLD